MIWVYKAEILLNLFINYPCYELFSSDTLFTTLEYIVISKFDIKIS